MGKKILKKDSLSFLSFRDTVKKINILKTNQDLVRDVVAADGRGMAPREPAIELVANFFVALAAVDSAAALSGAVIGSGGASGLPNSVGAVSVGDGSSSSSSSSGARSYSRALSVRRFVAAPSSSSSFSSVAAAAAALAALPSASSPDSNNVAARRRTLFQAAAAAAATTASTPIPTLTAGALVSPLSAAVAATTTTMAAAAVTMAATSTPASPYLVAPADLSAACLSSPPGTCGSTGFLSPNFAFSFDPQLLIAANQPVSVGSEIRYDAQPLTGVFTFWLRDPDTGADFSSLPAGASAVRLALPYASEAWVTQQDGLASPVSPPDPGSFARACLRLTGPSGWELETFDGEADGFAFCLTRSTGQFVVVTYPSSPSSSGGGGGSTSTPPPPPPPSPPPPPTTTTPSPTSPWIPPLPTGGFVVGGGTPPFGAETTTPQIAFYVLFDGFADFAAFEGAGGRAKFDEDLRAFFLSPLPHSEGHLLQRLFIFNVQTGSSGSGALVGAAIEFIGGAQGAQAALLLQKTAALLAQPALVFGSSSFYGRPTALSVAAYGGAVDPSAIPPPGSGGADGDGNGGGGPGGGSSSGGGKGRRANVGAVAGGVGGGLAALALLSLLTRRLLLGRRRGGGAGANSSASPPPQQFIANAAADPTRPQVVAVAAAAPQPPQPPPPPPPPPPAAGSAGGGSGLETPLVA